MEFFESLFGINKSQKHEDFDKFIKTSFVNYLNKSNLFKNFTKDFNNKNTELSYCKECNDLYILTNDIFEQYIKKIKIPLNIKFYNESYTKTPLYFFNKNDLDSILSKKKLLKDYNDPTKQNIKRFLCKIISITFIKIYIIVKTVYQTFNVHTLDYKDNNEFKNKEPLFNEPIIQKPSYEPSYEPEKKMALFENHEQQGGGMFDKFLGNFFKKDDNNESSQENIKPEEVKPEEVKPEEVEEEKIEEDKNIFYSIIKILLNINSNKDFNANHLRIKAESLDESQFVSNIKNLMQFLCKLNYNNPLEIVKKDSILFNDRNFEFIKLRINDEEKRSVQYYINDIDKDIIKRYKYNINKKEELITKIFDYNSVNDFYSYCDKFKESHIESIFKNDRILYEIKKVLQKIIRDYFDDRQKLYSDILKKIFVLDKETLEIKQIHNKLTYKKLVRLTEECKIIILDLHLRFLSNINYMISLFIDLFKIIENKQHNGFISDKQISEGLEKMSDSQNAFENMLNKSNEKLDELDEPPAEAPPAEEPPAEAPPAEEPPAEEPPAEAPPAEEPPAEEPPAEEPLAEEPLAEAEKLPEKSPTEEPLAEAEKLPEKSPTEEPLAEAEKPAEKPLAEAEKPAEKPLDEAEKPPEKSLAEAEEPAEKPLAEAEKPSEKPLAEAEKPAEKPLAEAEKPFEEPLAEAEKQEQGKINSIKIADSQKNSPNSFKKEIGGKKTKKTKKTKTKKTKKTKTKTKKTKNKKSKKTKKI